MTRTPRLVTAAIVLAAVTGALAALLWLAPAPERGGALPDPDVTGSVGDGAPAAPPDDSAANQMATNQIEPDPAPAAASARPPGFAAIRDGASLRLVGAVPDEADRAAILVAARARFVAEPVIDELVVASDAQPTPTPVAGLALAALARLAEGEARLADNAVAVEGRALYRQATQRIEDEMRLRLPEGWVATLQVVSPEPVAEPILAPLPSQAAAAPAPATTAPTAAGDADVVPPQEAEAGPETATATETATETATRSAEDAARPPRPQRAALTELALHPLPPRR